MAAEKHLGRNAVTVTGASEGFQRLAHDYFRLTGLVALRVVGQARGGLGAHRSREHVEECPERLVVRELPVHVTLGGEAVVLARDGSLVGLLEEPLQGGADLTQNFFFLLGLLPLQTGRVVIDGFDAARYPREARARMGALIERRRVWNLSVPLRQA